MLTGPDFSKLVISHNLLKGPFVHAKGQIL